MEHVSNRNQDLPDNNVEDNHSAYDATLDVVVNGKGKDCHGDKDNGEGVGDLGQEDLPEGESLGTFDGVWAVPGKAGGSLFTT